MTFPPAVPEVVRVAGVAREPFEPFVDILARTIASQGGGGAALAVQHRGETVVDLTGGSYAVDSAQLLFSVTKVVTAVAAAMAHAEGLLDLDAPVAAYWPAFAKESTAAVTPRLVLSHRSGLASLDRSFTLDELLAGEDERAIETQEPYWGPGTKHGYHAFTYGTLMNGVFRRTVGDTVGGFVAKRIAGPLGLELWIGTPESERSRIHPLTYLPPLVSEGRLGHGRTHGIPASTSARLAMTMDLYNDPAVPGAAWPSTTGVATARALAALMAATLDDGVLLSAEARRQMTATQAEGHDEVLGIPMHYGSGVQLPFPQLPFLGPGSYGHEGAGGSVAFADEDREVAVGFTTSVYPSMPGASPGFLALLPVLQHCLART
jgi:CubicO group peptidase (beta-lactamase class C family)